MKRVLVKASIISLLLAGAAFAVEPAVGVKLGQTPMEVSVALDVDGYQMSKFELEGRKIEVRAIKDDQRIYMKLDPQTGEVTHLTSRPRGGRTPMGVETTELLSSLKSEGYEVEEIERERGRIEAYASRDGARWELEIDAATGRTIRAERED